MRKNNRIIIILTLILILFTALFFIVQNNKSINSNKELLSYLVSSDTHSFKTIDSEDAINNYIDELYNNLSIYCSKDCVSNYLANRWSEYNRLFIEHNNIVKTDNIKVKLISEKRYDDDKTKYRYYEISYTYIDKNNKEYQLTDYYYVYVLNNKVVKIRIDIIKSEITKVH